MWFVQDTSEGCVVPGFQLDKKENLYDCQALSASFPSDWKFDIPAKEINKCYGYALGQGSIVNLVAEIATDGRVHKRQSRRLLLVGPYSDWQEYLEFAICMEVMPYTELKYHYVQRKKDYFEHGNVPSS